VNNYGDSVELHVFKVAIDYSLLFQNCWRHSVFRYCWNKRPWFARNSILKRVFRNRKNICWNCIPACAASLTNIWTCTCIKALPNSRDGARPSESANETQDKILWDMLLACLLCQSHKSFELVRGWTLYQILPMVQDHQKRLTRRRYYRRVLVNCSSQENVSGMNQEILRHWFRRDGNLLFMWNAFPPFANRRADLRHAFL